jgi:hypothetical protein
VKKSRLRKSRAKEHAGVRALVATALGVVREALSDPRPANLAGAREVTDRLEALLDQVLP